MKKWLILINVILLAGILSNPVSAASNFPVHWGFNKGKNEQQAGGRSKI